MNDLLNTTVAHYIVAAELQEGKVDMMNTQQVIHIGRMLCACVCVCSCSSVKHVKRGILKTVHHTQRV